jgi:hypothetical protein
MDARNKFETPSTYLLYRLEWGLALAVCVTLVLTHLREISWFPFIFLIVIIDAVGYIPGAIAYRRNKGKRIAKGYYIVYNITHSFITSGAVVGIWIIVSKPEWALLALPIHLCFDRSITGNTMKSFKLPFEPVKVQAFRDFEAALTAGERAGEHGWEQAGERVREAV